MLKVTLVVARGGSDSSSSNDDDDDDGGRRGRDASRARKIFFGRRDGVTGGTCSLARRELIDRRERSSRLRAISKTAVRSGGREGGNRWISLR